MRVIKVLIIPIFCILLISGCNSKLKTYPSVIEVITDEQPDSIQINKITEILNDNKYENNIYQWKNRIVLYDKFRDSGLIQEQIREALPTAIVRSYEDPFYIFERQMCDTKPVPGKRIHNIMSANLVEDPTLQQEYMDYHATQFEKRPEISQGFCNADFQELLIFKNGRQLMLIISIPEGKTLDELNPKTTENNPKVDEWNALMAKYQEGIEGSDPGEIWAMFKAL